MPSIPNYPYSSVRTRCAACMHAARSLAQADVYTLDWNGRPAVLKDFSKRPWLVRVLWARPVAGREVRALRRLAGVRGVPQLFGTAGPEAFIMELMQADRLPKSDKTPPPAAYWADAKRLMNEMHARGVAHGDLRRKNIMINANGEAILIDFATAMSRRKGWAAPFYNFLYERCRRIDRITLARIKASYNPELLDADEQLILASQPWYLRAGRWMKKNIYRWRKPRTWRKRLK
ncbi:hypothetical protein LLG95_04125 [bacterium]|nr:hypothetical protein [bacterium]